MLLLALTLLGLHKGKNDEDFNDIIKVNKKKEMKEN